MTTLSHLRSDVPFVSPYDLISFNPMSWTDIDTRFSTWVGKPVIFIPSIRVALNWLLESKGLTRNTSEILVPRYLGRCILNSLNRVSFPVQHISSNTKFALLVDQFGRRQNLSLISSFFNKHNISYVEDSPYCVNFNESVSCHSTGRFIGLSKVLPIVMGGLFMSSDEYLNSLLLSRRDRVSISSYGVFLSMACQRFKSPLKSTTLAEITYESFQSSAGLSFFMRSNITAAIIKLSLYENNNSERYEYFFSKFGEQILSPRAKLHQYLAFLPSDKGNLSAQYIDQLLIKPMRMMIDLNNSIVSPNYQPCMVIPICNDLPFNIFKKFVDDL